MANIYGRQVVLPLTNKSGGGVIAGDVVIVDTTNDTAFTTTTSARVEVSLGVAQETIANNASGRVLVAGYAALVNVPASVTRGHYVETHTVAKQATGNSTRRSGSCGQFLTGGTTPSAVLWGSTDPTASAGGTSSGASVTKSGSQATSSNPTTITWDTEDYDPDGYHDNGSNTNRLTVPTGKGGRLFLVSAVVEHNLGSASAILRVRKNGSGSLDEIGYSATIFVQALCFVVKLADADYVEALIVGVTSGSVINTDVPARFSIAPVG